MDHGFRPHDRDRTEESMEGVWMGFGPLWKGCWAANKRDFADLQMAQNLTGGLPVLYQGCLANLGPFRERLTPAHENKV